MSNSTIVNLQTTLQDLITELETTSDQLHREDLQRLIVRLEAAIADSEGVESLHNL